jgi:formyltetrahydrofolate deformylase
VSPHRLLIQCPDRPGIVAAVASQLRDIGANIVHADQHTTSNPDPKFFFRVEFEGVPVESAGMAMTSLQSEYQLKFHIYHGEYRPKIAIFVSKEDHCLVELLFHVRAGDIFGEIQSVVSNHPDLRELVEPFGIPFYCTPISPETKAETEAKQIELARNADLIVLAKYMQVLTPDFVSTFPGRIINIHHSFLPAFIGAKPYHQAHERGVKLIGATAHYVTDELDMGPIIEQDVQRVDHRSEPQELRRLGKMVERSVLARAVKWHCEDRILLNGNRTVVFN